MHPLLETLGGIGLFLYGMAAMTSGLQKLSGERLRHWLSRSTRTPIKGVLTGAATTAVVQSSSATTVAVVGFVSAGLLTFEQTLGIIFGANIGTTITGWMVAMIGFKLKLSVIALPLLFLAAVLYLVKSRPRVRGAGGALAGFCLIFLGISYLQQGLAEYRGVIDLGRWQADHLGHRLLLVLVGGVLTLITQSSSASVATALTALNASVLTLPQAAAVIIGADIGTTITAAFATIGGSTASRRTGFAHVIYNVITGVVAFLALPFYVWAVGEWFPEALNSSREVVAVAFHTIFNTAGVVLALPLTRPFARLIIRLFPERTPTLVAPFDKKLQDDPAAAVEALVRGTRTLAAAAVGQAAETLSKDKEWQGRERIEEMLLAVETARGFAIQIGSRSGVAGFPTQRIFAALHILDHVERLVDRTRDEPRAKHAREESAFIALVDEMEAEFALLVGILEGGTISVKTVGQLEAYAKRLEDDKEGFRADLLSKAASGALTADQLDLGLDCRRWCRRLVYHVWRISYYCQEAMDPNSRTPNTDGGIPPIVDP